ncbi:hypothetical protein ERJ75_000134900 [Trypanosoma vivax]|uniref:Uncharacterized protein n=1 Tax=Trypanosoma vivax (strain Y486) TaxID=1055687 RepID=G0TT17_TRYVY|nr:hypothetical protein TRVL_02498 [Trypanosoma vivax]KAH8619725.1 hypothetical protein ERJ75_000134900 [Trypanosoma vivax]CCC47098.1 conserved hypothetical protein [Trypanosoma vivax Y486]
MLNLTLIRRATLALYQPVPTSSIHASVAVAQLLGNRGRPIPNISVINSLLAKTGGQGLCGSACIIGKAQFFVYRKNPGIAVAEIDKVLPGICDEAVKRLAIGVRLLARNELLDVKEAGARVEGGATELDVSSLRAALKEDYRALKEASPGCWLVELGLAEYCLYEGSAEEAYVSFCKVESDLEEFMSSIRQPKSVPEAHTQELKHLCLLLTFLLNRANSVDVPTSSFSPLVGISVEAMKGVDSFKDTLLAFKKMLDVPLDDEEAIEVAHILESAYIRHHFHDFFPMDGDYDTWHSKSSRSLEGKIRNNFIPTKAYLSNETLETVRRSVLHEAFYAPEDKLRAFLSSEHQDLIAELRSTFGRGPGASLSNHDEVYLSAARTLEQASFSAHSAASPAYAAQQLGVAWQLAHQLLYRTRVNVAAALIQLDRLQEAVRILDAVIEGDDYIHMWRAYLMRAEAHKKLGLVSKSDKDFRQLSKLKK